MAVDKEISFENLRFGTILDGLLDNDNVTNINCWYHRVVINDNVKGEYVLDMSSYSQDEIDEYEEVIKKLPNRLSNRMEVAYNEGSPILDAEADYLDKGRLRINAIHESLNGSDGPAISIRRTKMSVRVTKEGMIETNYASEEIFNLLSTLIKSGNNIMISGITNAGKTEILRYMARYIKDNESIITIEDTREAYLEQNYPTKHVLALKSNAQKNFSDLIKTCLRQNPSWICVSETRGEEVIDLLNAAETGHKFISTIHADSTVSIPSRMVSMAKVTDGTESNRIYRQIHENVDIGIYIYYYEDEEGSHRQIAEISEFYIDENGQPTNHYLCEFDYKKNKYVYNKIKSKKIIRNIIRTKTDTEGIKGVFYD